MPSCVMKTCKNQSVSKKKNSGVTYHRFPRPDHEKREAWIKFVQKNRKEDTWLPTDHTLICSDHFKSEDKYITKTGRIFLKKNAVPYDDNESISEPLSESESTFHSLREIVLKKKLLKEMTAKRVLAAKLRNTQSQNRYLKRKCAYYKSIVRDMLRVKSKIS